MIEAAIYEISPLQTLADARDCKGRKEPPSRSFPGGEWARRLILRHAQEPRSLLLNQIPNYLMPILFDVLLATDRDPEVFAV